MGYRCVACAVSLASTRVIFVPGTPTACQPPRYVPSVRRQAPSSRTPNEARSRSVPLCGASRRLCTRQRPAIADRHPQLHRLAVTDCLWGLAVRTNSQSSDARKPPISTPPTTAATAAAVNVNPAERNRMSSPSRHSERPERIRASAASMSATARTISGHAAIRVYTPAEAMKHKYAESPILQSNATAAAIAGRMPDDCPEGETRGCVSPNSGHVTVHRPGPQAGNRSICRNHGPCVSVRA